MPNDFYNHDDGYPAFGAQGASAAMRAELDKIGQGFNKLPTLVGNGGKPLMVAADGLSVQAITAFTDTTFGNVSTLAHGLVPKLPGGTASFFRADGTFAATPSSSLVEIQRSSNTVIDSSNLSQIIRYTGTTNFTQTLVSAAAAGTGFFCYLLNANTADIEIQSPASITTASTTSNSIAAGVTWTVGVGLGIAIGDTIVLRRTADPYNQRITGTVSAYNSGSGVLTATVLARVGSGTFTDWTVTTCLVANSIDGVASYVMYQGELRMLYIDAPGLAWRTAVIKPFYRKALVSFVYIHPPGYSSVDADLIGGGGGGGSGRRGAAASFRNGGAPGGAPSRIQRHILNLVASASYAIAIGANGTGGVVQSVDNTNGNPGTTGGNTSFSTLWTAFGGIGGIGGGNATIVTTGSGSIASGVSTTAASAGGAPTPNAALGAAANVDNIGDGGGGGTNTSLSGNSEWGGAGAGSQPNAATVTLSGSSIRGVSAAGHGGHITDTNTFPATAGTTGRNKTYTVGGGSLGGVCGAVPTAGTDGAATTSDDDAGNPGSGGGSSASVAAQRGGNGSLPGGPGGGGGASLNGLNSGAGGDGAPGRVIIQGVC